MEEHLEWIKETKGNNKVEKIERIERDTKQMTSNCNQNCQQLWTISLG